MMCDEKKRHRYVRVVLDTLLYLLGMSLLNTMAICSVADPDPGSGVFLTPGSGICFFPDTGFWILLPYSESLVEIFWEKVIQFLLIRSIFFCTCLKIKSFTISVKLVATKKVRQQICFPSSFVVVGSRIWDR
jgi:hypothetical protein